MKPRHQYAVFILFSVTSGSLTPAGPLDQRDEKMERSRAVASIPKKCDYAIGSLKRNQCVSLHDKALEITGDTDFSRKLEQEELKEGKLRRELQQGNVDSSFAFHYSGFFIPILLAFVNNGFATSFLTFRKSANVLMVTWLPVLLFNATWIERISVALLLVRPAIWSFLVNEFFTDTWAILKKLLLSELWRHFWKHATKIAPMPILSPPAECLALTPGWFQMGWTHANKVVDRFVQGVLRKSVERCFQESLGIAVGVISESVLEQGQKSLGLGQFEASTAYEPSAGETEV